MFAACAKVVGCCEGGGATHAHHITCYSIHTRAHTRRCRLNRCLMLSLSLFMLKARKSLLSVDIKTGITVARVFALC